jgi:hypothetical protein
MPEVTIVGAGIAGLSAALRLVERGFSVAIFEQNHFLGGKLGAHQRPPSSDYHEHSYHMYLNWYHNFWQIIDELKIRDRFVAQPTCSYLGRKQFSQDPIELRNVGSTETALENMFSGLRAPADMFIYGYSLIDLLGTPPQHAQLARTSVFAFMNARAYMTQRALELHGETLAKAFACPTVLTDSRSYRNFINYGFRTPSPMVSLLRGNTQQYLFEPLIDHIQNVARQSGAYLRLDTSSKVTRLHLEDGRVASLQVARLEASPSVDDPRGPQASHHGYEQRVDGAVILAVPHVALGDLVDEKVYACAPDLGNVRKLHSQPMASIDVYFKRRLAGISKGINILLNSRYDVTFLDNSQVWDLPDRRGATFLNVVLSDFQVLAAYRTVLDRKDLQEYVLRELSDYLEFFYDSSSTDPDEKNDDVDRARCHLKMNIGEPLFTNQVDSMKYRPETTCRIPNLFIAGDYCRTFIDVTTIESAVVSGLMAAEAVRRQAGIGTEIAIRRAETYPQLLLSAMKAMGMPAAYAAKAFTAMSDVMYAGYKERFPNH